MLVDIILCALFGFLSIRLCEKLAFEHEKDFKICLIIVFFTVITGLVLCIVQLIMNFNIINWAIFTIFVLTITYGLFANSINRLKNKELFISCMFLIGTLTSALYYSTISWIIKLIQL